MRITLSLFVLLSFLSVALAAGNTITTLKEEFSGKLYVYEDREEALSGLKSMLSEKMEQRLKGMGFSEDYTITLLKRGDFKNLMVVEKRVEILKDGKKLKTRAFDLYGEMYIALDEQDIRALGEDLRRYSPVSEEEKTFYKNALKGFLDLSSQIRDMDLSVFRIKLAEILKAEIIKQMQGIFGADSTSFTTLKDRAVDVINYIEANSVYLDVESNLSEVINNLISNIESYYKRSVIDITSYQNAIDCAEGISKMLPHKKEETLKNLLFIIEFKWAENIQNISQSSNVELSRIYSEIEGFTTRFPNSKFLRNIINKVSSRILDELKAEGLDYDHFKHILTIKERLNLKDREITGLVIERCETIMESVESPSDEVSAEISRSFDSCIKISPPDKKKKLMAFRDRFIKSDKTRIYKNSLGSLAFIIRFLRYADYIPFGGSIESIHSSKYTDFENEGSLTSSCSCSQDSTDECRVYTYAGEQFEVVLSTHNSKVYKISICNMNMSGKEAAVFAFLKDSFKPLFKGDSSTFVGRDGSFEYEFKKGVILNLEKIGTSGNLSIYYKYLKPKEEKSLSYTSRDTTGSLFLKKGDCVEWDCEVECRYQGRVEKVSGNEIQVVITSAPKASELNMRKSIGKSSLRQCTNY
jgi:hypothetical protein